MITIEAGVLARAMKTAAAVAAAVTETRNIIPILSNVLLRSVDGGLEIVTSDLDVEYRQVLPLTHTGSIETTVDARRLASVASAADKGAQLALDIDDGRLLVKSGRSRWRMPVLPVGDFPQLTLGEDNSALSFEGADLAALLSRVLWAASTEGTRYYLNGPLLHAEEGKVALAATNGHVLASVVSAADYPEDAPEVILAPKWARLVESLAREAAEVDLAWGDKMVRAVCRSSRDGPAITLTGKVIDGNFPDYRRVIPAAADDAITVDPEALRGAIAKVTVLAIEKTRAVRIDREDSLLRLSCTSPDSGTSTVEHPADCVPAGFVVGFDARYLEQMLAAVGGDSARIQSTGPSDPARVERVGSDNFIGVVMPMRV